MPQSLPKTDWLAFSSGNQRVRAMPVLKSQTFRSVHLPSEKKPAMLPTWKFIQTSPTSTFRGNTFIARVRAFRSPLATPAGHGALAEARKHLDRRTHVLSPGFPVHWHRLFSLSFIQSSQASGPPSCRFPCPSRWPPSDQAGDAQMIPNIVSTSETYEQISPSPRLA